MNNKTLKKKLKPNIRYHISGLKINKLVSARSSQLVEDYTIKPKGLWYAFGDEWLDFIDDKNICCWLYQLNFIPKEVIRILSPNPNKILVVDNFKTLNAFNKIYGVIVPLDLPFYGMKMGFLKPILDKLPVMWIPINWHQVVKDFAGIEITPKMYRLLNTFLNKKKINVLENIFGLKVLIWQVGVFGMKILQINQLI